MVPGPLGPITQGPVIVTTGGEAGMQASWNETPSLPVPQSHMSLALLPWLQAATTKEISAAGTHHRARGISPVCSTPSPDALTGSSSGALGPAVHVTRYGELPLEAAEVSVTASGTPRPG